MIEEVDIVIYNAWLNFVKEHGGVIIQNMSPIDRNFNRDVYKKYEYIKEKLFIDYKLLRYTGKDNGWITFTKEGSIASDIGFECFIKQLEYKEKLELENLIANIETAKEARKISKKSLWVSIIALAMAMVAPTFAELVSFYINKPNDFKKTENTNYQNNYNKINNGKTESYFIVKDSIENSLDSIKK